MPESLDQLDIAFTERLNAGRTAPLLPCVEKNGLCVFGEMRQHVVWKAGCCYFSALGEIKGEGERL
jgi:hypothetical protein